MAIHINLALSSQKTSCREHRKGTLVSAVYYEMEMKFCHLTLNLVEEHLIHHCFLNIFLVQFAKLKVENTGFRKDPTTELTTPIYELLEMCFLKIVLIAFISF